jgi:hypothetical protein
VTVQLADRYNNPAPDGTSVAFTTNGGHVGGSCTTPLATAGDGECTVTWTSANPRPSTSSTPPVFRNGRAQILATAIGEESFDDVNSTGYYQAGDPFSDLGEPYLDANESGAYKSGDYFLDYYSKGVYQGPSGKFVGITCTASSCTEATLAIGVEHLLIMSTSGSYVFFNTDGSASFTNPADGSVGLSLPVSPAAPGAPITTGIYILVTDQNGNAMPAGTTVAVTTTIGTVSGTGASYTVGCNETGGPGASSPYTVPKSYISMGTSGGNAQGILLTSPTTGGTGQISITVTSPQAKAISGGTIPLTIS